MKLSNECLVNENLTKEIKSQVIGCQSQMGKFDLFFELHFGHRLYSHTDNLSKSFQSGKMFAASSKRLANLTKKWNNCDLFQSQSYAASVVHLVIPSLSSSRNETSNTYHPNTPRDYYRLIYYEALNSLITSLKESLINPTLKLMLKYRIPAA